MELDDLKNAWEDVSHLVEKKSVLTTEMIYQMIRTKYQRRIKKIAYPEFAGAIICLAGAVFIGLNIYKLDTNILRATGILSILLLLILPVISILSVRRLNIQKDMTKPYEETLRTFATQKIQFHKYQRLNISLCYLLLVAIIILLSKLFGENDITRSKYFWIFSFSFGYILLLFYSKFVFKYYKKTLYQAEELLKELNRG